MLQREFTKAFEEKYASFWANIQKLISDLKNKNDHDLIYPQTETIFLLLSELRRIGELMGRSDRPNDIVKNAPPQYFTSRAQRHQSFYGTEFGYACWYIQANLGYTLSYLIDGDTLDSLMTEFEIKKFKIFPRHFPLEYAAQGPMLSRLAIPTTSNSSNYVNTPESSLTLEPRGPNNTPAPSVLAGSGSANTSVSSIYVEPKEPNNTPTSSIGSDAAKLSHQTTRPDIPASLAGFPSLLQYTIPGKPVRRAGYPRVRVTSPDETTSNPTRTGRRRRPTPYPERGDLFKKRSKKRSSATPSVSPIPPPSPYRGAEGQDLKPRASFADTQAHEQPFYDPKPDTS